MRKILTIARREYLAMVGTKAFLISIAMMPVLMFGSILISGTLSDIGEVEDRQVVIVDETGQLFAPLRAAAQSHNERVEEVSDDEEKRRQLGVGGPGSRFILEQLETSELSDDRLLALSERVRKHELDAFVIIPADVAGTPSAPAGAAVKYYSEGGVFSDSRRWLAGTINDLIRTQRLQQAGINPDTVKLASIPVQVEGLGLFERSKDGTVQAAQEREDVVAIFLPFGIMMLMFMVIFLAAQPMLESVMEEKSERIAEVLLGSANPFQLMLGKLLGNVGGSLSIFVLYFTGVFLVAHFKGWTPMIPFEIAPWFVAFQIVAVMFFSSIFMAVGASVRQLKEAQSMLLPVWLVMMFPLFVWFQAIRAPNGTIATWMSFFPPATPLMMVLRMATGATVPIWQPIVGLIVLLLVTLLVVKVAGRIFRIGIMWQGKTPKLSEVLKWAWSG